MTRTPPSEVDFPPGELARFDAASIEVLDDGLCHQRPTGMIYRRAAVSDHAVAEYWADGRFIPLALPIGEQPRTIDQWRTARAEQERVAAEQAETRRRLLVATRRPVTLAWLEGLPSLPTLAAAHRRLLAEEALVEVDDHGRLNIELSPNAGAIDMFGGMTVLPMSEAALRDAVRVMFAAERTVVELLAAGRDLPDADIGPTGTPLP